MGGQTDQPTRLSTELAQGDDADVSSISCGRKPACFTQREGRGGLVCPSGKHSLLEEGEISGADYRGKGTDSGSGHMMPLERGREREGPGQAETQGASERLRAAERKGSGLGRGHQDPGGHGAEPQRAGVDQAGGGPTERGAEMLVGPAAHAGGPLSTVAPRLGRATAPTGRGQPGRPGRLGGNRSPCVCEAQPPGQPGRQCPQTPTLLVSGTVRPPHD